MDELRIELLIVWTCHDFEVWKSVDNLVVSYNNLSSELSQWPSLSIGSVLLTLAYDDRIISLIHFDFVFAHVDVSQKGWLPLDKSWKVLLVMMRNVWGWWRSGGAQSSQHARQSLLLPIDWCRTQINSKLRPQTADVSTQLLKGTVCKIRPQL